MEEEPIGNYEGWESTLSLEDGVWEWVSCVSRTNNLWESIILSLKGKLEEEGGSFIHSGMQTLMGKNNGEYKITHECKKKEVVDHLWYLQR